MKKYISLLLVLFLVSGCSFSFNMKNNEEVSNNKLDSDIEQIIAKEYTYAQMTGEYSGSQLLEEYDDGPNSVVSLHLHLYQNGTFSYLAISGGAPSGFVGNYTIENNAINLNNIATMSGLYYDVLNLDYNHQLIIKSDDIVIDPNYNNIGYIELKRTTDTKLDDTEDYFGFNGVMRRLIKEDNE